MEIDQIKQLNPQYRRNIVNGSTRPMALRLPATLVGKFIDNEDSIYAYRPDVLLAKRTEVEVNDDVPSYSRRSSSSSRSKSTSRNSRSKGKKGKKNKGGRNVTIRQGDTLSDIAKRNGTTVSKLKKLNKISGSSIRAGKKLRIK